MARRDRCRERSIGQRAPIAPPATLAASKRSHNTCTRLIYSGRHTPIPRAARRLDVATKKPQQHLLEVAVIPLEPARWEWRVYEGDTPLMAGFEGSRETAQINGDSALFRLLSAASDK
jgi:hypothetical protein